MVKEPSVLHKPLQKGCLKTRYNCRPTVCSHSWSVWHREKTLKPVSSVLQMDTGTVINWVGAEG